MILKWQMIRFALLSGLLLVSGCKARRDERRDSGALSSSAEGDLEKGLSREQKEAIGQLLSEIANHIGKFDLEIKLSGTLDKSLNLCGNSVRQAPQASLLDSVSGIRPCVSAARDKESMKTALRSIATLRRSGAMNKRIDEFNEKILPAILNSLFKASSTKVSLDPGKINLIVETINNIAVRAQTYAGTIMWKPSFLVTTRYLHQALLTELTKEKTAEIDWEIVRQATDAHLDIFPLSPWDAAVTPVVLSYKDPLYKTLYGPSPRGAAHWLMAAAATLRLPSYSGSAGAIELPPVELRQLESVERQILLESPEDQAVIKLGLAHLRAGFEKIMR